MNDFYGSYYLIDWLIVKTDTFNTNHFAGNPIYEVFRIIDGIPLFIENHIDRLNNSAKLMNIDLKVDTFIFENRISELSKINKITDGNIKIVVTSQNSENHIIAYFTPHSYPSIENYKNGVYAILLHAERINPNAKVLNTKTRQIAEQAIESKKAYEAILIDNNGFVTEGSRSNIFFIKNNSIITAPQNDVLPGITRAYVLEICAKLNLEIIEQKVHYSAINQFDAVFLSRTSAKVLPITKIDDFKFNYQNINLYKIMQAFNTIVEEYISKKKLSLSI